MGEIYRGNSAISAIYRGQTAITNVYRGQTQIWTPPSGYDSDAQAFFNAVSGEGITLTETEKNAVNALVVGLKADNIWAKMDGLYPFVGSDADAMKYNLKDPVDTDAGYRITWYENASYPNTFNSDGVTIGADYRSFGLTHLVPSMYNTTDGAHMALWCNNVNNTTGYDMGAFSNGNDWALIISYGNNTQYANFNGTTYIQDGNTPTEGFFLANNNGTTTELVKDNTVLNTGTETINVSGWNSNVSLAIGGRFDGTTGEVSGDSESGRGYGFASIGEGLSSSERGNLYTRVNTFITALSR